MQFGANQKLKFNSPIGAYSLVTEREFYDSQITATDSEANLLINFFGRENLHIGNVASDKTKSGKIFKLYPDGKEILLNVVFPKPNKTELRLYLSTRAGFKPTAGAVWFMFEKDHALWIGSMPESVWRDENSIIVYDETENAYQDSLLELDEIKINNLRARDVFSRDRNLGLARLRLENYTCEYDAKHPLFYSRHTQVPYLEAHHLIPMALQKITAKKLDVLENIFCLCPYCHRAIHHAERELTKDIVFKLLDKRQNLLNLMGMQPSDILGFYALEEIC